MNKATAGEVVATTGGRVRGRRVAGGVRATLGIPYAAPPFGAGRFREPRPASAWGGVRDCDRFGPVAPQSAHLPGAPAWSPDQDDMLSVNVWAPERAAGPLPVLFWIHGGAYTFGSSAQPEYDGAELARAGLVVATCNYRLGFEGFGHVPGLPANRGLLDQVAALNWVRDNIAGFGGDPGNVTVAGQSAGAGSVACLLTMDRSRGLFRRAIAHSVPDAYYPPGFAAGLTRKVAAAAGIPATAGGLLSAAPHALVAASDRVVQDYRADPASGPLHYDTVIYGPVLDGDVLATDPLSALSAGAVREVDLLLCHTTQESWLMHRTGSMPPVTDEEGLARFAAAFGLPDALVAGYRALLPDAPVLEVYLAMAGDAVFAEHTAGLARAHAGAGGRAFLSRFARRRTSPDGGTARPWHAADVPFAFGNLDAAGVDFLIGGVPDGQDRALSRRMVRAWADFCATGDPGWPRLTAASAPVRSWGVPEDRMAEDDATAVHALWRGVVPSRLRLCGGI
ncbi:carboxylesterase/lipase family protein [Streptosporangium canum]|uniref:carboxylesterase/lipase family protein n=1 Tax=Streptosporangium canum TaxID=324952 RepID=UPI0037968D72